MNELNPQELHHEYDVVYQNRLGILCGTGEPTRHQMDIAAKEADDTIEKLKSK